MRDRGATAIVVTALTTATALSLATFAITTFLVALRATTGVDLAVTEALQSDASAPLDVLANANTLIGQPAVTVVIAALLAFVAWRREPQVAWLALALFIVVGAVGLVLKIELVHPPPPEQFQRSSWDPLGLSMDTPSGFPSGHIARVTFLAIVAAATVRTKPVFVALTVLVGYTFWARIYIGDHWISDAIGGLALGVAAGCAALMWIERRRAYARQP
jgi:undecaprenyl-diphosphatase